MAYFLDLNFSRGCFGEGKTLSSFRFSWGGGGFLISFDFGIERGILFWLLFCGALNKGLRISQYYFLGEVDFRLLHLHFLSGELLFGIGRRFCSRGKLNGG